MSAQPRIAVIGAGPAGILAALELRDRGFTDITIVGPPDAAQVRTVDVDGVAADVACCYTHCGYWDTIIPLVRRFGQRVVHLGEPTVLDAHQDRRSATCAGRLAGIGRLLRFLALELEFLRVHRQAGAQAYAMPFSDFLAERGLGDLARSFALGAGGVAQGYGPWDGVTAYAALQWFRPSLFLTPAMNRFNRGTAAIEGGYGPLFARIRSGFPGLPVLASSVMPKAGGGVEVALVDGGRLEVDQAIVACSGRDIATPISGLLAGATTSTRLGSFLWTSRTGHPHRTRVYLRHHIEAMALDTMQAYRTYGRTAGGSHVYWGVGYAAPGTDAAALEQAFRRQAADELGLTVEDVRFHQVFDYNLRFTGAAIAQGLPQAIERQQGIGGIWYAGGLLSHWNLNAIHHFSRRLAGRIGHGLALRSAWRDLRFRLGQRLADLREL